MCFDQGQELAYEDDRHSFLGDTCQQYLSPVFIGKIPYKNIFCFLCRKRSSSSIGGCDTDRGGKLSDGKVTSLLDDHTPTEEGNDFRRMSDLAGDLKGKCSCNQVYDTNIVSRSELKVYTVDVTHITQYTHVRNKKIETLKGARLLWWK